MECAKRTFASRGYYATSISEIVQQAGVARGTFYQHFERAWTKDQKDSTTILFGGLTVAHEELALEDMRGLWYKLRRLPTADNDALTVGKEYGNRGQVYTPPITLWAVWSTTCRA